MSTLEPKQPTEKEEDITIMQTFIKSILLSNQILMIIIFLVLWFLSNSAQGQIQDAISEFQSPCIPAGTSGKVGWKRSLSGSISTCDLSNNTPSQTVTTLLNGVPSLDLSGNTQTATAIWVGFGITMSLILMFSPYLLFIPKVIIRGILWIIAWIGYYFIKNPNPKKLSPEKAAEEQNYIVTESRDKMWNTFTNLINNFVPTKKFDPEKKAIDTLKGGSTLEDFLESFAEKVGGDMGDCGGVIRFFIGLVQIIFLLIFSELNSGNSLRITTMLFSLFISLIVIFMLLGSLKPDPNYKFTFIISAVVLGLVFILLKIFFNKNISMITQIISSVCLILSICLSIYSTTDPKDFASSSLSSSSKGGQKDNENNINYESIRENIGDIIISIGHGKFEDLFKKEEENMQEGGGESQESLGCLIYNYCSAMQDSFGFGVAKIILIILGIVFLPNYNNNSVNKMMQESYGMPKTIFTGFVILFIVIYTLLPWYSLWKSSKSGNEKKLEKIPFYTTACKFISLQICGVEINKSSCSS